jgi:diacylglycerol kinase (ATP)
MLLISSHLQMDGFADGSPAGGAVSSGATRLDRDAPYRRAIVVANPVAGRGKGRAAALELEEGLKRMGASTGVYLTEGRGDAWHFLRSMEEDVDLVVAVGGDGTIGEILHGLVDPEVPVGILPLGTGNILAAELGLPRDVHRALEIFERKKTARIDVATVNGNLRSFLVVGVGFDGYAVREVAARRTGPISKLSYLPAALRALGDYREPSLEVEIDGEPVEGGPFGLVLASNINHYGGFMRLSPEGRPDDGRFEVYLFRGGSPFRLAGHAARGVFGRLLGKSCLVRPARRLRVTSEEPVPVQVDGDAAGETPVHLEVEHDVQYRILVP